MFFVFVFEESCGISTFLANYKDGEMWWTVRTLAFSLPLKVHLQVTLGKRVANIFFPVMSFKFFMVFIAYYIEVCGLNVVKHIHLFL